MILTNKVQVGINRGDNLNNKDQTQEVALELIKLLSI